MGAFVTKKNDRWRRLKTIPEEQFAVIAIECEDDLAILNGVFQYLYILPTRMTFGDAFHFVASRSNELNAGERKIFVSQEFHQAAEK